MSVTLPGTGAVIKTDTLADGSAVQNVRLDLGAGATAGVVAGTVPVTPPVTSQTTREFNLDAGLSQAFATASTAGIALPPLGTTRELRLRATAQCYIVFGIGAGIAATSGATSLLIETALPDVIRVPATATHFAVIRDTADGILRLTPVV
jgi:hypothetical protein